MWLAVVTTIVAGLVLVLVVLWRGGFGRGGGFRGVAEAKRNALLIVGVSGEGDDPSPGKTSLFFLLKTGNAVSMDSWVEEWVNLWIAYVG